MDADKAYELKLRNSCWNPLSFGGYVNYAHFKPGILKRFEATDPFNCKINSVHSLSTGLYKCVQ